MNLKKLAGVLALALSASVAQAANFSFTGNFTYDNDVQSFSFVVGSQSDVTLRSWSYAGGVNAAGQAIVRGGFDPILALFDAAGNKIDEQDDADCSLVAADAVTGLCYDSFYIRNLAAGSYTVTVMQYDNFSRGDTLAEGFVYEGVQHRNFRDGFHDVSDDKRTSSWAFDILNVNDAVIPGGNVPEPGSLALLGLGLAGVAAARRRKSA